MKVVSVEVRDATGVVFQQVRRENDRSRQIIPAALEVAVESEEVGRLPVVIHIEVSNEELEVIGGETPAREHNKVTEVIESVEQLFTRVPTPEEEKKGAAFVEFIAEVNEVDAVEKTAQGNSHE